MKKVFSTILAAAFAVGMSAAVTPHFGLELGYDHGSRARHSNITGVETGTITNSGLNGFHVGGNVQLDFMEGQHIPSVVVGLNYQYAGANGWCSKDGFKKNKEDVIKEYEKLGAKDVKYKDHMAIHSLQIPIRAQYAYAFGDCRVFAFTGPQIRLHLAANYNDERTYTYDGKKGGYVDKGNALTGKGTYTYWEEGKEKSKSYKPESSEEKDGLEPWFDMSWGFGVGFGWKAISLSISYDLGMCNMISKAEKKAAKEINKKYVENDNVLAVTLGVRLK